MVHVLAPHRLPKARGLVVKLGDALFQWCKLQHSTYGQCQPTNVEVTHCVAWARNGTGQLMCDSQVPTPTASGLLLEVGVTNFSALDCTLTRLLGARVTTRAGWVPAGLQPTGVVQELCCSCWANMLPDDHS